MQASTDDPFDKLALAVGRVVVAHTDLEGQMYRLYQHFCGTSLVRTLRLDSFEKLRQALGHLLKLSELDSDWDVAATKLLAVLSDVNTKRNRLVHDEWFPALDSGQVLSDTWMRSQRKASEIFSTPQTVAELEDLHTQLLRATLRTMALTWFLQEVSLTNPEVWLKVIRDEFDLSPDGGFRPL